MRRILMVMALATLAGSGALPAQQQQQERERQDRERQERAELERRMRELQNELRDVQRQLSQITREERTRAVRVQPRTVIFPRNRARIGVTVRTDRDPAKDSIGAELTSVTPSGPAGQAGLRTGDIITTFNGERLAGRYPAASEYESEPGMKLVHFAQDLDDGDTVVVEYRRGNERQRATLVARELEPENWYSYGFTVDPPKFRAEMGPLMGKLASDLVFAFGDRWLDMELVSLNPELGEYFGTNEGLLVIRAPRDSSLNLKGGDVILRIDGRIASSHSQLMRIFRSYSAGESVQVEIMRQKRRMTVTATIPERDKDHPWDWEHR